MHASAISGQIRNVTQSSFYYMRVHLDALLCSPDSRKAT